MKHWLSFILMIIVVGFCVTQSLTSEIKAQSGLFLQPPFNGTYQLTAYVDHREPWAYDSHMIVFNGEEYLDCPAAGDSWTNQGPFCYDSHEGTDWALPSNTPVLAAAAGTVIHRGSIPGFPTYGNVIRIDHGNGYETWYAHLAEFSVDLNDDVVAGQQIGLSGNTGEGQPYHLHFEVRRTHNNRQTDPFGWQGEGDDPLIEFAGEAATCLWANEWCHETMVEDGDANYDRTTVKFAQFGDEQLWQ